MDIVDTLTDRLRILMREHKVKAAPLARAAKLNESAVRDILRGRSKNPGIVTLKKIASVLNLRPSALFEAGQSWPIAGSIGADGVVTTHDSDLNGVGFVENPFFAYRSENYLALVDRSGALAPLAYEGDYLIFQPRESGVLQSDLGRPCVCDLEDGRRLIRILRMGDTPTSFHLTPLNLYGAPQTNVSIVRASRVALALPADFAPDLPKPTHVPASDTLHEEQAPYGTAPK